MRGNPYPHRYKHGKLEHTITLEEFDQMVEVIDSLDLKIGRKVFSPLFVKSLLSVLYWTGLRKTEVIGAVPHRYRVKDGFKFTAKIEGILKRHIIERDDKLYITALARKHGKRESPLIIHLSRLHANLIKEQWLRTEEKERVWVINEWRCWALFKKIDYKFYPHWLRFIRITKLAEDPRNSLADICAWTGLTPQTVSVYLARAGRYTEEVAERMEE